MPEAWGLEAFSTIGRLLSITKRTKLGTGIVNIYSRSAANIAMACVTLNQLAPGRFLLGLGVSGKQLVETFHGARYAKPFKRLQEYVDVIKGIQSGGQIDYDGEILKLAKFHLWAAPASPPVPIYLGAMGEKSLALAGKIGDGAIVTFYPLSKLGHAFETINQADPLRKKKVFAYIPLRLVNNERDEATAKLELAKTLAFYVVSMGKYYSENLSRLGYAKQVEEIKSAAGSGGNSSEVAKVISEDFLKEFALIGRPFQIFERLAKLPEGINPVFVLKASSSTEGDQSARALREVSVELASKKPRGI